MIDVEPKMLDPVVEAQKALDAVQPPPNATDFQKAHAIVKAAEAMVKLIEALKEKADAEIKAGKPGACCDNLFSFIRAPMLHNKKALAVIKGPQIVIAKG